jgi:hypothetical protein
VILLGIHVPEPATTVGERTKQERRKGGREGMEGEGGKEGEAGGKGEAVSVVNRAKASWAVVRR